VTTLSPSQLIHFYALTWRKQVQDRKIASIGVCTSSWI